MNGEVVTAVEFNRKTCDMRERLRRYLPIVLLDLISIDQSQRFTKNIVYNRSGG